MKKEFKEADIKKANNIEKCKIIKAIIRRTSNIYKGVIIMQNITIETRKESYKNPNLKRKTRLIYEQLGNGEYTARELATKMYNTKDKEGNRLIRTAERQEVAPRLTELVDNGLIEAIKKKYDEISGCRVAVYRKCEKIL